MESAEGGDISCLAELIQTSVLKFSKKILAHLTSLERIDDIPLLISDITYLCELPPLFRFVSFCFAKAKQNETKRRGLL